MSKLAPVVLGLAVLLVGPLCPVNAEDKVDVTGTWEVEVDLNGQTGMPEFKLKQDGEKITGRYKGQFGEADVTGKIKGDEIEFTFEAQGAKIIYTGKVDKETMKGDANYADQAKGTWKGKRTSKKGPELSP